MVIKQNHMSKNLSEIHMWLPPKFIFYFFASLNVTFPPSMEGWGWEAILSPSLLFYAGLSSSV